MKTTQNLPTGMISNELLALEKALCSFFDELETIDATDDINDIEKIKGS